MSDEGEKTCPLCAEEMDLTDQQLRPCKCGYDICVWCWHHIMDMAEKDDTEGRCPACRTPYNKEKIVGTASKCERLVAEINVEKKQKSQKGKTKTSEGRKQLSSVRVIQRNLVYIVGLPLNLADEDLLQRKEYFGQYGKVLKVSISRTAAGAIQHFGNNTCSVYITFANEEAAVRSIQSVHGFILKGKPLRACFGTTKYCHAWLRSMPCTNADCLYLHEFGSQEDSFTKDEIISEYTRGRVQQITGATNDMQRRSGIILPPAADDYSNNSTSAWGKPISKISTNESANSMKGSPPNSSTGRSVALPAAASWGTRTSTSQPLTTNTVSSNGFSKQKEEIPTPEEKFKAKNQSSEPAKPFMDTDHMKNLTGICATKRPLSTTESIGVTPNFSKSSESCRQPTVLSPNKDLDVSNDRRIYKLSTDISSLETCRNSELQVSDDEKLLELLDTNSVQNIAVSEAEADLLYFNEQRLRDPEVVTHTSYVQQSIPQSSHLNNSTSYSPRGNRNLSQASLPDTYNQPVVNGHLSSNLHGDSLSEGSNGQSYISRKQTGIFDDSANGGHSIAMDLGENSIISNILSMDFDPWGDEPLASPQNLVKLLGDGDKQNGSPRLSRKTQNCNQSRFSFAREDERYRGSNFTSNLSDFGPGLNLQNSNHDFVDNGFSSFSFEESDRTANNLSSLSSNKISVSRSQISAPPGFLGPSRAPPPGFASNERIEQPYDNQSGNHMFDASSLPRKMHHTPAPVYNNGSITDLELMDPAILAVGGRVLGSPTLDMRPNYPSQPGSFENDNRLRLLFQKSFTQHNQRFNEPGGNFPQRTNGYGELPDNRSFYQQGNFQQPGSLLMSNGLWDGWNEGHSRNDVAMAELLRNERLGFNKYHLDYEDTKFRLPSSGDVYKRTYGI